MGAEGVDGAEGEDFGTDGNMGAFEAGTGQGAWITGLLDGTGKGSGVYGGGDGM